MILVIKVLSLYLAAIVIMRLMGKSTIIQMTPYDLVAIIITGTVVSEPLISTEYMQTIYVLGILMALHIFFGKLTLWQWGNGFFLGKPTILIKNGEIVEDNIEKSRLSVAQLLSILRSKGYPKISDVDYAMLEPIGEVSVIPKSDNSPVTVGNLNITIDDEGLPIAVIIDGKTQYKNLKLLGKSEEWLIEHLDQHGLKEKDVLYAYVTDKTKRLEISKRTK